MAETSHGERVQLQELRTNSGVVLVNSADAPQLPLHVAVVQELRASFSRQQEILRPPKPVTNTSREASKLNSSTSGPISSTSTNTTLVADIEDSGVMEEPVFLETESKSDELARRGLLLNQPSRNCVSTCGHGSQESTKTTTEGQTMNLIPHQKNVDSSTGNGFLTNHEMTHREPETDSPSYVNIITNQHAPVHTSEQSNAIQYSLSQPLLTEYSQSPTYVNHTEIPFCQCRICRTSVDDKGHGYANVPPYESSLSQPLLDNNKSSRHCPQYVNQTQVQSSSTSKLDCAPKPASLSRLKHQISAPTNAVQVNEQASSDHHGHNDGDDSVHGYVNISSGAEMMSPPLEQKSASSHPHEPTSTSPCSLPPQTQQSTTSHCEVAQPNISNQTSDSCYEDASSLAPKASRETFPAPRTLTETVVHVCHSASNQSTCSTMTSDRGYVNITKPRSISQPTPVTASMLNPSLVPPRTIPRANFHQPRVSDSKSRDAHALPPRPRSRTTQDVHALPPRSSEMVRPPLTPLVLAGDLQPMKCTEIETKSSSGCSSGSSVQLDGTIQTEKRCKHEKPRNSSRNTCRDRGCSCEPIEDDSYVVDELEISDTKGTESVESLDIWPPVIPPQTELMFIVAPHQPESVDQKEFGGGPQDDPTDTDTKNIKMTTNKSYVKHND